MFSYVIWLNIDKVMKVDIIFFIIWVRKSRWANCIWTYTATLWLSCSENSDQSDTIVSAFPTVLCCFSQNWRLIYSCFQCPNISMHSWMPPYAPSVLFLLFSTFLMSYSPHKRLNSCTVRYLVSLAEPLETNMLPKNSKKEDLSEEPYAEQKEDTFIGPKSPTTGWSSSSLFSFHYFFSQTTQDSGDIQGDNIKTTS